VGIKTHLFVFSLQRNNGFASRMRYFEANQEYFYQAATIRLSRKLLSSKKPDLPVILLQAGPVKNFTIYGFRFIPQNNRKNHGLPLIRSKKIRTGYSHYFGFVKVMKRPA